MTGAKDESPWKNSGLNDLEANDNRHPNFRWKKWKSEKTPRHWHATGEGETKEKPDRPGDYYVSFTSGEFSQYYLPLAAGNNVIRFRARGKGSVWTEHKLHRESLGKADEKISIRFICGKDSAVELDDICVSPQGR